MNQWIEVRHTQKNNDNYMKMVQIKRLLVLLNYRYEQFSEVMVNVNDLYNVHLWRELL